MDTTSLFAAEPSPDCGRLWDGDCIEFSSTEESLILSHRFLDACGKKYGVPKKAARYILICSDEITSNIVSYAHAETVRIRYGISGSAVILTFEDDGIPYDPLHFKEPDVTLPAKKRPPGGLGLFMVRKMAKSVEYAEINGRNCLKLVIELDSDPVTG